MSVWNKTTGISALRVFDYDDADEQKWLDFRCTGIGGSDIAAVCGVNPWASPLDIYAQKIGRYKREENEAMHWGKTLEAVIADEYKRRNAHCDVRRVRSVLRHETDEIAIVNLDRIILRSGMPTGVLEIKNASEYQSKKWESENIPDQYMAQVQWELYVTGLVWGAVAVLIGGRQYMEIEVRRNDDIIKILVDRAHAFWKNHILTGVAPEPSQASDAETIASIFERSNGAATELPETAAELAKRYLDINQQISSLETEKETVGAKLKAMLGESEVGDCGEYVVSWKTSKDSDWFDKEAFKRANPDLARAFTFSKPGSRRFTVKQITKMREAA